MENVVHYNKILINIQFPKQKPHFICIIMRYLNLLGSIPIANYISSIITQLLDDN